MGGSGENGDNNDQEDQEDERGYEFVEWIQTTAEPTGWEENGGFGTMDVFNKMLVIRITLEVHEVLGGPFHIDK